VTTTLYLGGHVYTPVDPEATALVVDGDSVAWVGRDGAARSGADEVDHVVPLDGALITPAFVDAHVHTTSTGLALIGLDLSTATSVEDVLDLVERHARSTRGGVVLGHGWDESGWPEPRPPSREEVDRASYGAVVYLSRVDVHSCVASSALMAVTPEIKAQPGYDESGWLRQQAHHTVRAAAFESVTAHQRAVAQRAALTHAASLGIGMVHELGGPDISGADDFRALLELARTEVTPEVIGYWGEAGGPQAALELGARGAAGDLFIDGAIGSRTALLREAYSDDDTFGAEYLDAAQIRDHIAACSLAGVQAGFHVIGDGAMDLMAAGFVEAAEQVGSGTLRAARHRIEHAEMLDAHHIAVFADLGVVASVQPMFDELWGGSDGMYASRLGADRASMLNPFAAMVDAGIPLAFGSDAPVTPLGPWEAVRAAAHHHNPAHRITVRAAFNAHTRGGWRAAGMDDGGVLAPGAPANLAVWNAGELVVQTPDARVAAWSTDPRAGVPGLPDLQHDRPVPQCLRTVVRGTTVFTHEERQEIQ